jgi:hypothetical protein
MLAAFTSVVPFIVGDQWAVDATGRIAILRWDDYRVDFVMPSGTVVRGQPIPFRRVRVSEAHKAEWREEERARLAGSPAVVREPGRWPEFMPPFPTRPASFAPDGTLWVLRTGAAGANALYDLVDAGGRVVRHVTFAPRSRVIGFGARSVYVVRRDEDDLEYLERFAWP